MRKPVGWTVYIMECADKSLHVGYCRDMARALMKKYSRRGRWFTNHPERLPVKIVFCEDHLHFKEAMAKYLYAREMNRRLKTNLIKTRKWPYGGSLRVYLETGKIKIFYQQSNKNKENT
jgi:predicted GIY-YIG superfamily endonuclease